MKKIIAILVFLTSCASAQTFDVQNLKVAGTAAMPGLPTSGTSANSLCTDSSGNLIAKSAANCFGGAGSVTSFSVVNSNNFTSTVTNPTTTPALTIGVNSGLSGSLLWASGTSLAAAGLSSDLNFSGGTLSLTHGGSINISSVSSSNTNYNIPFVAASNTAGYYASTIANGFYYNPGTGGGELIVPGELSLQGSTVTFPTTYGTTSNTFTFTGNSSVIFPQSGQLDVLPEIETLTTTGTIPTDQLSHVVIIGGVGTPTITLPLSTPSPNGTILYILCSTFSCTIQSQGTDSIYLGTQISSVTSFSMVQGDSAIMVSQPSSGDWTVFSGNVLSTLSGAKSVAAVSNTSSSSFYPLYVSGTGNSEIPSIDAGFSFNPSSGLIVPVAIKPTTYADVNGNLIESSTAVTVSAGFGASPTVTGSNTAAFVVAVGSSPGGTGSITFTAAPHGWNCAVTDRTSASSIVVSEVAGASSTIANFQAYSRTTGATTSFNASDVLQFNCAAY